MPSRTESRATVYVLWGSGLLAVVAIVFAVRYLTRERVPIHTTQAAYEDLVKTVSTNGKVEPVDPFTAYAQSPAIIDDIYVGPGDKVKAGQLLMKLDDAEARARLAAANSRLEAAKQSLSDIARGGTLDERNTYDADLTRVTQQVQQDQRDLAALQNLQQRGAASPAEVTEAQQHLQIDQDSLKSIQQRSTQRYGDADRASARARLNDAQAEVAAAEDAVANDNIRSKVSGTVYSIPYSVYDYVAPPNNDLIYVADLSHIQVVAYFDEPDIEALAVGQPVTIVWEAKPRMVWHGHITQVPISIVNYTGSRNVGECEIAVDDADGQLQPNANVTVTVTTAQHNHVLSIPHAAVNTDGPEVSYVYRIVDDKLVRTPVQIGIENPTRVEVLSGLAEGDTVALNPVTPHNLDDGLEVTPVK